MSLALAAGAAVLAAGVGSDLIGGSPRPGEGQRRRPTGSYTPKTPTTPADHERLRLAEMKRARKAAKRMVLAERGGWR